MSILAQTNNGPTTISIPLAGLAADANLLAGSESASFALAASNLVDAILSGKITTGTTPGVNTTIEVWIVGSLNSTPSWPDVFDGTASAETVTSRNVLNSCAVLVQSITVDANSDRPYNIRPVGLAQFFGGVLPSHAVLFVTHNTGAGLNATAGNHALQLTPVQYTNA